MKVLDGKVVSAQVLEECRVEVEELVSKGLLG